jgi:uncharacterized metal-binding protein YceD (DUF177 family)
MSATLRIDPSNLPADGLHLEGKLPSSVFALSEKETVRAVSPLEYRLDITRDGNDIIVLGSIGAVFDLQCGRCTERFQFRVEEPHYVLDVPVENEAPIDLTSWLREDILLALPTHPRCETGNVTPRECPAEGRFAPTEPSSGGEPAEGGGKVWEALDQLKNLKRK